jgi:hypothetical protein
MLFSRLAAQLARGKRTNPSTGNENRREQWREAEKLLRGPNFRYRLAESDKAKGL